MTRAAIAAAGLAVLSGCTTVSEVIPLGKDTYMVGSQARGGMTSNTEVKGLALKRANEFCAAQGKVMSLDAASAAGIQGWTPQTSEVTFFCLDASDPANKRVRVRSRPDAVIEIVKPD